jgi:hypothetical protein
MIDIETKNRLQEMERELAELRVRTSRLPAVLAKSPTGFSVTVYEFRNCSAPERAIFLDNVDISEHEAGEVAVVKIDGEYDCWRLIGPAPFCKTGECAVIMAWGADCDACSVCFYLTPCGGGSPTFVRGVEWWEYEGRGVKLDGPGHEGCYTLAEADGCFDVDEALSVEHVVDDYADCDGCGCYELTNCADSGDVVYASGDLASIVKADSGVDAIGKFVKRRGVCYEITGFANPCGTDPAVWDLDEVDQISGCEGCCWLLTPCPDQPGDPEPAYYRLAADDPDLTEFTNGDGTSNGRVLRIANICYTVSIPETCPEEDVILGLPTVQEEYDSCDDCIETCWERCDSPGTYIRTYSDLSDVGPNAAVKRAEDGFCYKRATLSECEGDPLVVITPEAIIDEGVDSCDICTDPKVKLTPSCGSGCGDCSGSSSGGSGSGSTAIVTDSAAFFPHVGKFVKVNGECHFVEWTTDATAGEIECWTGPYDSCESCRAAPTQRTFVVREGDGFVGLTIEGSFNICGRVGVTDDCPNEAVNIYALQSIL